MEYAVNALKQLPQKRHNTTLEIPHCFQYPYLKIKKRDFTHNVSHFYYYH